MRRLLCLVAAFVAIPVHAQDVFQCFDDQAREAQFRELIHTIRCMKCQNQSIAESPVDQAQDIKRQACELQRDEGFSDGQVRTWLADRYGDFINYRPPFKPTTWLLWSAPLLLLVGGGVVFARILRNRMSQPLDEDLE
jgi:cytochrome c-type biogenesis protein CcmH